MCTITLDDAQTGRVLAGLKERRRKLEKGINKFGDKFDPVKGARMTEALEAHNELINLITEKCHVE